MDKSGKKIIAQNRKAHHDYFVEDTIEAGIVLTGTEIKSIRNGAVNLKDSYCMVNNGEIYSEGIHISPYEKGNIYNKDPLRRRKLLLHKKEILKLSQKINKEGYTLVPLSLYYSGSNCKVELGVCKGKKLYDKRDSDARETDRREMEKYSKAQSRIDS